MLDTLRAIHLRHPQSIAFENLSPLLGRPVRLDAQSLAEEAGVRRAWRLLLRAEPPAQPRVEGPGLPRRRARRARTLEYSGGRRQAAEPHVAAGPSRGRPYIADVGFGGLTLTAPLRLQADIEQATPHEPFRLIVSWGQRGIRPAGADWRRVEAPLPFRPAGAAAAGLRGHQLVLSRTIRSRSS